MTDFKLALDVTDASNPVFTVSGTGGAQLVALDSVKVKVSAGTISVSGAERVAVYTTSGTLVSTSATTTVPSGLYIVKAGSKAHKVAVK